MISIRGVDSGSGIRTCRVRIVTREITLLAALAMPALWWLGGLAGEGGGDPDEDARVATWQAHRLPADDLEFSPEGGILASSGYDGAVSFWNPRSGRATGPSIGSAARPGTTPIGFSGDGAILAAGRAEGGVELWDPARGESLGRVGGEDVAYSLEISRDGKTLAVGTRGGKIRLWDLARPAVCATLDGHTGPVRAVRFARHGSALASGGSDGRVLLWDLRGASPSPEVVAAAAGPVSALCVSPDGTLLAWGSRGSSSVEVRDLIGSRRGSVPCGGSRSASALAFHPDGRRLFAAGVGWGVRAFSLETWASIADLPLGSGWAKALAISPDGLALAAADSDGTLRVWNLDP